MIREIKSPNPDTLVYELDDYITQYEIDIIDIGIGNVLKNFDKVNLMIYIDIKGENLGALIEMIEVELKHWNDIYKIAFIGDSKKGGALIKIENYFTKFKERYFQIDELSKAWDWINE